MNESALGLLIVHLKQVEGCTRDLAYACLRCWPPEHNDEPE